METVWFTKSGKQYYPNRSKSAITPMLLSEVRRKGYSASAGYNKYKINELKNGYK